MIQIDPYQRPQVLLLGNGLNRTFGGNSWTDLMKQISVRSDLPETLTCPYPLQAVLVTNDHVKKAMEDYRNEFFGTVNGELQKQLQALLKVAFDDILTTNYSYEIEAAAVSKERPTETFLKKPAGMWRTVKGRNPNTCFIRASAFPSTPTKTASGTFTERRESQTA